MEKKYTPDEVVEYVRRFVKTYKHMDEITETDDLMQDLYVECLSCENPTYHGLRSECLKVIRKHMREHEIKSKSHIPFTDMDIEGYVMDGKFYENLAEMVLINDTLKSILESLSLPRRFVIVERFVNDQTARDISKNADIPVKNIRRMEKAALNYLRQPEIMEYLQDILDNL